MTVPSPEGERIQPALPVTAMKTFSILAPRSTHTRPGTCEEAGCANYLNGWVTIVPADSAAADYIRGDRSRMCIEERAADGLARFTFGSGQRCFAEHRVPLERPEIFIEREGDWRGNPRREVRTHVRADDWVDSFANHQQKLADRLAQG